MLENYLGGEVGVQINAFMSGTAWNLKKMIQKLREEFCRLFFICFFRMSFAVMWFEKGVNKD
jgi:IS5 family transposase